MEDNLLETEFNFLANDDDEVLKGEEARSSYKLQSQQKDESKHVPVVSRNKEMKKN